ncbi:MAG TPA: FecR family protein [Chitinophagaceae bacterium]|nr:FecR family protein [Chitinophagaceae bacterium]
MYKELLEKFFLNTATSAERELALQYLSDPDNDLLVLRWMKENWDLISNTDLSEEDDPDIQKIWAGIQQKLGTGPFTTAIPANNQSIPSRFRIYFRLTAAAAILIAMLSGIVYYMLDKPAIPGRADSAVNEPNKGNDIAPPERSKAVLSLSDGTKIYLDKAGNGIIASQGKVDIIKNSRGEIVYKGVSAGLATLNTLSLPRGSKPVQLALSDGSMVWLNAASSITYPTVFTGKERAVTITGEAYFEVAKNPDMPFYVSHDHMKVKVLGTHFNVNTYPDEKDIKVTLLEGSVAVEMDDQNRFLKPGQQLRLAENKQQLYGSVDLDEVMAWKNEKFIFNGSDIQTIMRQVEKYYDVNIEYRDTIPYRFVAKISRQVNVSGFLEKLELTKLVHFKIENKKIIVTK